MENNMSRCWGTNFYSLSFLQRLHIQLHHFPNSLSPINTHPISHALTNSWVGTNKSDKRGHCIALWCWDTALSCKPCRNHHPTDKTVGCLFRFLASPWFTCQSTDSNCMAQAIPPWFIPQTPLSTTICSPLPDKLTIFLFNPYRSTQPLTEGNYLMDTYLYLFFSKLLLSEISSFINKLKCHKNSFSSHRCGFSKSSSPIATVSYWAPPPQEELTPKVFALMIFGKWIWHIHFLVLLNLFMFTLIFFSGFIFNIT